MSNNVIVMPNRKRQVTQFGYQPIRVVLYEQNISQQQAAKDLGVPWSHFRRCVTGRTRPMGILRKKLPEYLGVPLEDLFTPEILAKPYLYEQGAAK